MSKIAFSTSFAAVALSAQLSSAQMGVDYDPLPVITTPSQMDDFYAHVNSVSFISDGEAQCVHASLTTMNENAEHTARLQEIYNILSEGGRITRAISETFRNSGSAFCFVDLKADYPNITAAAMHFPFHGMIIIDSEESEGCQVSHAIHEMQHRIQFMNGLPAPYPDLVVEDQQELIVSTELDAHTMQIVGGVELAQNGYDGALNCLLEDEHDEVNFYMYEASALASTLVAEQPSGMENGHIAAQIHDYLEGVETLVNRYKMSASFLYDMFDPNSFTQIHSLGDVGLDLDDLGTIHYGRDYRSMSFMPTP